MRDNQKKNKKTGTTGKKAAFSEFSAGKKSVKEKKSKELNRKKKSKTGEEKYRDDYLWEEDYAYDDYEAGEDYDENYDDYYDEDDDYEESFEEYEPVTKSGRVKRRDSSDNYKYEEEYYEEEDAGDYYDSEDYYDSGDYYDSKSYGDYDDFGDRRASSDRVKSAGKKSAKQTGKKTSSKGKKTSAGKSGGKTAASSRKKKKQTGNVIVDFLTHMNAMDRVVAATGAIVLIAAMVTGGIYSSARTVQAQVAAMAEIGEQLEQVGIAGEDVFVAVADARLAGQEAAAASEDTEYEEKELDTSVSIGLKLSSIQKDLKIKFTNKNTGKLIPRVSFSVDIKGPENLSKTDDDQDGIIYLKDITPGEYTVTVTGPEEIDGSKVAGIEGAVTVKASPDYKKVDVSDEVKTESEINAAKEDTQVALPEESTLKDTVEWVESTKTPIGDSKESYEEVKKADIPDPGASASADFVRLAGKLPAIETEDLLLAQNNKDTRDVSGNDGTEEGGGDNGEGGETGGGETEGGGETGDGGNTENPDPSLKSISLSQSSLSLKEGESSTLSYTLDPSDYQGSPSWSSDNESVASVSGGTVTAHKAGTAKITVSLDGKSASCTVTVSSTEKKLESISISTKEAAVTQGDSIQLSVSATPGDASGLKFAWSSDNSGVAEVDQNGKVTGKSAGTANITVTATDSQGTKLTQSCKVTVSKKKEALTVSLSNFEMVAGTTKNWKDLPVKTTGEVGSVSITVNGGSSVASNGKTYVKVSGENIQALRSIKDVKVKITVKGTGQNNGESSSAEAVLTVVAAGVDEVVLSQTSATLKVGETLQLTAKVGTSGYTGVIWESKDPSIASVDDHGNGLVKALKPGKTQIIAHSSEVMEKTAVCEITVVSDKDLSGLLKDKDGNQLYYKDSKGNYIEAKQEDYYKYDVFYRKKDATEYKYTGWQTLDGKTYFFDKNGNKVTGDQVIQGMKYSFDSDGVLKQSSGIMGIDVSKHNGNIDWNAVRDSGVNFVIIRCGYRGSATGALVIDPKFKANIQGATAAGLKVGVYFFSQAVNEAEAIEEASMALDLIKGYKISYPVFIDVEASNGRGDTISSAQRTAVVDAFCKTIQNGGYTPGIYANRSWLTGKMNMGSLNKYKVWYAQYAASPTYTGRFDMWQYSSRGRISGISGNVDLNISYLGY